MKIYSTSFSLNMFITNIIIIYALFEFHYMNSMFNKNELTLFATEDSNPGASEVHMLS